MKAEEYVEAIKAFGLSLAGAGRFFRANERTSRRWADPSAENEGPPRAVAMTLRLMRKHGETPASVEALMTEKDGPK